MSAYLSNLGINIDPDQFVPIEDALDNVAATAENTGDTVQENVEGSTDVTVEEETATATDNTTFTNLVPEPGAVIDVTSEMPIGTSADGKITSQPFTAHVQGVQYRAEPVTIPNTKETTGQSVDIKYNKGKGGKGKVNLKKGAQGRKGGSGSGGGRKARSASRPSSSGGGGRGGGGRGGGGGGGGGSEKTYTPKHKDPVEEKIDLYEKVNTKLNDVQETLKNIQQETNRLIGPSGQANMRKQLSLLQKEIDLQNEKLDIQQKERDNLRNQLNPFGVTFDSEGFISNYADVFKSLENRINDLINQYNADTTEEGQNRLEKEIEGAKKNLDKFKEIYKRYDELQGKEIQETINQIEKLKDNIEDLSIEAYKASQKALDNIKDIRNG